MAEESRPQVRAPIVPMLLVGAIASALGIALGLVIDWFPEQASTQADDIDTLYDVLVIVSVPVFVLVTTVVLFSVWKFRMKPGEEALDGPPIHGNTRLEVVWTAIPAILLVALCSYAYVVLTDIEEAQAGEMRINVTGQQFAWTFTYPGNGGKPVTSTELYLPKDKPVRFFVKSEDVIHDFWVPAFRMKIDAVPGITTDYRVTPTKLGRYAVVCAELCGAGHAFMRQDARVVSQSAYDAWLREQQSPGRNAAPGGAAGGGAAPDGKTIFNGDGGCAGCHTLADADATGTTGPDLDETLPGQSVQEISESIVNPDAKIARGFQKGIMPPTYEDTLQPAELTALSEYLEQVAGK